MRGKNLPDHYVLCLIDVLGQKKKLDKWAKWPPNGQLNPDFMDAFNQTAGLVEGYEDEFKNNVKLLDEKFSPDQLGGLPKPWQEGYKRTEDCDVLIERFSDTFLLFSLLPNMHGDASSTPLHRILRTCCIFMLVSLARKVPLRGAITVGTGAVLHDESFYGPALAEAHHLESAIVGYPRVIVSPAVCEFLAEGKVYSQNSETQQIMQHTAQECRSFLSQDVDGYWIVDFLGEGIRNLLDTDIHAKTMARKGFDFVQSELARFQQAGDAKLTPRYWLLKRYIESRLPNWGISQKTCH